MTILYTVDRISRKDKRYISKIIKEDINTKNTEENIENK